MGSSSYKVVVQEFAAAIRSGAIPAGSRLPTHRALARQRRMALATATRVYAELAAFGLVVGEPGRGTFVRVRSGYDGLEPSRSLPVPRVADLSFNQPLAPGQSDLLRRALHTMAVSGNVEELLYQQPPGGHRHDRAVVATYLLGRGIDTVPDNVLLTSGAQQALDTVLRTLTRPGDALAVDELSYPGIKLIASAHGLDLVPVPCAVAGPDLAALDRLCRSRSVRAIYTMPTVHNPLGWVLTREQRERLAALARAHDCLIVEDGTYAFLEPSPPPPLQALAPERTCYVAGLSKNVAPGLRFGFAVLPGRHLTAATTGLPERRLGSTRDRHRSRHRLDRRRNGHPPGAGTPCGRGRPAGHRPRRARRAGRHGTPAFLHRVARPGAPPASRSRRGRARGARHPRLHRGRLRHRSSPVPGSAAGPGDTSPGPARECAA